MGSAAGLVGFIYLPKAGNMENNSPSARGWASLEETELARILISNTFYKGRLRSGNMSRPPELWSLADSRECAWAQ